MSLPIFSNNVAQTLDAAINDLAPDSVFVLTDDNVRRFVIPLLSESRIKENTAFEVIEAGEANKNLVSAEKVWRMLSERNATRNSLLINIGGGVITDLGGFAASVFKRGIRFINIPTTLLAAIDASSGGKTGIDFLGLKNEIGLFAEPAATIISSRFFSTLSRNEFLSGFAEMIKHGLLDSDSHVSGLLSSYPSIGNDHDFLKILKRSVDVKLRYASADPFDKDRRKSLNLGHTAGHAFESLFMDGRNNLPHGYAVAHGLVVALVLSVIIKKFPSDMLYQVANFVKNNYGPLPFGCEHYDKLLDFMRHDKKNRYPNEINFTLLSAPGIPVIDCAIDSSDIRDALDIYRDLTQ